MLRAFRAETSGWDAVRAAAWARRILGWLLLAAVVGLACRVQLMPGVAAFGMALLSAALLAGHSAAALLVGCVAASLGETLADFNLRLPVGAAIALSGSLLWDALRQRAVSSEAPRGFRHRLMENLARSPNGAAQAACALLAGLATLIPALVWAGVEWTPFAAPQALALAQAVGSALAAVAAAPFLWSAARLRPGRRFLVQEEKAGLALLLGMAVAGLGAVTPPGAAGLAQAMLLTLYPVGASLGAGLGLALLAVGADARLTALLATGGPIAQLCHGFSRPGRVGATAGATLLLSAFLKVPLAWMAALTVGALAALTLPGDWTRPALRWVSPGRPACDPDKLAAQLRRQTERQLNALSSAFGELAEGYLRPCALPDEGALMTAMREKLCEGCAGYAACWAGDDNRAARLMCDLIAGAVDWSGGGMAAALFESEVPPSLLRRCRRGRLIPERLGEMLEDFARVRQSELKRGAENRLISAQFLQARELLDGLASAQAKPVRLRGRQSERAAAVLERAGLPIAEVMTLDDGEVSMICTLREGDWSPEALSLAARRLFRAFGRSYVPVETWAREARFVRRPRYAARVGVGCASREAGVPSGDSHLTCMLDHERMLLLICDGMGSGEAAAAESAAAVKLLGRFLAAGADVALAVETVNALLLNRAREDMFATVDMLILNLSDGTADMVKLAAGPTLILREGEARWVEGGRLPMGILEKVQPARARTRLMPGDRLLMASDGVTDCLPPDALVALMEGDAAMPDVAQRILAEAASAGGRRDDMTCVCVELRLETERREGISRPAAI